MYATHSITLLAKLGSPDRAGSTSHVYAISVGGLTLSPSPIQGSRWSSHTDVGFTEERGHDAELFFLAIHHHVGLLTTQVGDLV